MGITLLDLVEELKTSNIEYACFDWSAEYGEILLFSSGTVHNENEILKIFREANSISKPYEDLMIKLLRENYPDFDDALGTYGEMYVYSTGRIEINLTKRVVSEDYHSMEIDLGAHSSVG